MLEQALAAAVPDMVRGLPGPVETCHFEGCEEPAPRGLRNVQLAAPPSQQLYHLDSIALCEPHLVRAQTGGQLTLKYHPADRGRLVAPPG